MTEDKPVMLLTNAPEIISSVVFSPAIVGLWAVPQQTPAADILSPPSENIFPPQTAPSEVMAVTAEVDKDGAVLAVSFLLQDTDTDSKPMRNNARVPDHFIL